MRLIMDVRRQWPTPQQALAAGDFVQAPNGKVAKTEVWGKVAVEANDYPSCAEAAKAAFSGPGARVSTHTSYPLGEHEPLPAGAIDARPKATPTHIPEVSNAGQGEQGAAREVEAPGPLEAAAAQADGGPVLDQAAAPAKRKPGRPRKAAAPDHGAADQGQAGQGQR